MITGTHARALYYRALKSCLAASMLAAGSPAFGGKGTIDTTAKTLDLTVLFTYEETDDNLDSSTVASDWREVFNDASARLWQATNGQLKIGKVTVYRRAFNKKDDADVWINNGNGGAYATGVKVLGTSGEHMSFYKDTHRSISASYQGGFSITHEIGHYVFGCYDQYLGASVPFAKRSSFTNADLSGYTKNSFIFSATENDAVASLMDGGGGVNNTRTEFDTAGNTNKGQAQGTSRFWMTKQWIVNKESCWETIGKFKFNGVTVCPTVPAGDSPTDVPAGSTAITWEVIPTLSRLVLCIDRSGSMDTDNRMELAKLGASILVNLTQERHEFKIFEGTADEEQVVFEGDRLGVVDFDDVVTTDFALKEVDAAGTAKTQARAAIGALFARGSTAIGDGANRSLSLITGAGDKVTQEAIILLSDGANNTGASPVAAAGSALLRGAKIYTVALGSGADAGTLAAMSFITGGQFYQATNGLGLFDIYTRIYSELRGGGLVSSLSDVLFENSNEQQRVMVDEFTEEVTFSVSSPTSGFNLEITSPAGKKYTASDPADRVLYENSGNEVHFRVSAPRVGQWTVSVSSPSSDTDTTYQYNLIANSSNQQVTVSTRTEKATYAYPEPVKIECRVIAGDPVAGAIVNAEITGPDGILGRVDLFDDGAAIHGDFEAGDGLYTNLYSAFPQSGTYNIEVRVENRNGVSTQVGEDTTTRQQPHRIPAFTRNTTSTVQVTGVPAVNKDWLRVDALNLSRKSEEATDGSFSFRATLNAPPSDFQPQVSTLTLRVDGDNVISLTADKFLSTRSPNVFKIQDKDQGISGTLRAFTGGSSRSELLLTFKKLGTAGFDFDETSTVQLIVGSFSESVTLSNTASTNRVSYNARKNFAQTKILYVDGLQAKIDAKQNARDSVRLVGTFDGPDPAYDPAADELLLDLGSLRVTVPAGTLKNNSSGTRAKGKLALGDGTLNITVDSDKRVVTVNGSHLNIGAQLQQTSVIGLSLGTFSDRSIVTAQSKTKRGKTVLSF